MARIKRSQSKVSSATDRALRAAYAHRAAGKEYVGKIVDFGLPVRLAAWLYYTEEKAARLAIVSNEVESVGPLEMYELLFKAYDASVLPKSIDPFEIDLYGPETRLGLSLVLQLESAIRNRRLQRNINGDWVGAKGMMLAIYPDLSDAPPLTTLTNADARRILMPVQGLISYEPRSELFSRIVSGSWPTFKTSVLSALAA